MLPKLEELPVRYAGRLRGWGVIPFLLLTVASGLLLPSLEMNTSPHRAPQKEDPFFEALLEMQGNFERSSFIILALENHEGGEVLSDRMLRRLDSLSSRISSIDGVAGIISPANLSDIYIDAENLAFREVPMERAGEVVRETPLFRKMLLSEDGDAATVLVVPESSEREIEVSRKIVSLIETGEFGEVHVLGYPVVSHFVDIGTQSDFYLLTSIAAGMMLLAFILIARKIKVGLMLWISAVLPVLWTTALFPLFAVEMRITGILVPVLTLGLATTYSVHLFRYARTDHHEGRRGVLRGVTPIIGAAALTTMLGFATLLLAAEPELRHLGLFIMCGIVFSVLSSLFFLPSLLFARGNSIGIIQSSTRRSRSVLSNVNSRVPAVMIIAAAVALGAGAYRIHSDYRVENLFKSNHPLAQNAEYFNETYGGIEEIEILIDTNEEYGLVSPEVYDSIRRITTELERVEYVNHVLSIVDFVDWANGRLAGVNEPLPPESDVQIGEVLELLAGGDVGLSLESLVNPDYSQTRVLLKFGYSGTDAKYYAPTLRIISEAIEKSVSEHLPDSDFLIGGTPIEKKHILSSLTRSVGMSVVVFFPVVFCLLLLVFKSAKRAVLPLIPAATGVIVYFGAMGWLGFPFNIVTNVAIATAMGVSVDDAIYYLLYYQHRKLKVGVDIALKATRKNTGTAIIQTTVIINICLMVLLFSTYRSVTQAGMMIIIGFTFAMLVTLFVMPQLIRRIDKMLPAAKENDT